LIQAAAVGACIVLPEGCIVITIAASAATNGAATATGKKPKGEAMRSFLVDTALGGVDFTVAKAVKNYARSYSLSKGHATVLQGASTGPGGAIAVGTIIQTARQRRNTPGTPCRQSVAAKRPC
jgi:hypothetical protein